MLAGGAAGQRRRDSLAVLCVKFARLFPSFRLPETLEHFSTPKPLGEHMSLFSPTLQRDFVNAVVWMLRHDLLQQLHVYVYLLVPVGGVARARIYVSMCVCDAARRTARHKLLPMRRRPTAASTCRTTRRAPCWRFISPPTN